MKRLLCDDMGLGKTRMALNLIPLDWGALVICPVNPKFGWKSEAQQLLPDCMITVCKSAKEFRLPVANEILICNFEQVNGAMAHQASPDMPFVTIVDEIHKIKSPTAKRTKNAREILEACRSVGGRTYGLTGTPLPNRTLEFWHIATALDVHKVAFPKGWQEFVGLAGLIQVSYPGTKKDPKTGKMIRTTVQVWEQGYPPKPEFAERLNRVMIRRERHEVFTQCPPKTFVKRYLPLVGADGTKIKSLFQELKGFDEDSAQVKLEDKLVLGVLSEIRNLAASIRIPQMLNWIEEHEDEYPKSVMGLYPSPIIVASAHRPPIDALKGRTDWALITGDTPPERREEIAEQFRAGKLSGIGLTITAGGTGINLYRTESIEEGTELYCPGARRMLFVDCDWRPTEMAQCEDRLRPHLLKESCEYTYLVLDHPIERMVWNAIERKKEVLRASGILKSQPVVAKEE